MYKTICLISITLLRRKLRDIFKMKSLVFSSTSFHLYSRSTSDISKTKTISINVYFLSPKNKVTNSQHLHVAHPQPGDLQVVLNIHGNFPMSCPQYAWYFYYKLSSIYMALVLQVVNMDSTFLSMCFLFLGLRIGEYSFKLVRGEEMSVKCVYHHFSNTFGTFPDTANCVLGHFCHNCAFDLVFSKPVEEGIYESLS